MEQFSPRTQGLIAINIAAVIFGSAALFGKLDVSPVWIVAMRSIFAALALLALGITRRNNTGVPPKSQWLTLLSTGILLAIHWITFFISVQSAGVAIATLTFAAFPLFTVFIETFHQRRKPHVAEIMAAIAIIVAVGFLINPQNSHDQFLGVVSGLASAMTFAWFGHASKQLGKTLSPLRLSLFQNVVVAGILVPFLFFVGSPPQTTMDWVWLILLGVVTTAIMHQLYFYALRRLSASTCSGFVALEPVYAIVFAALFFDEPISLWTIASGSLIIGASYTLLRLEPHE